MSGKTKSDGELLDLLLIALTWVREDAAGQSIGWTYNGIFQTLRHVGTVNDAQYRHVASGSSSTLAKYLMDNGDLAFPPQLTSSRAQRTRGPIRTALPSRSTCVKLAATSEKLLVIMVNRPLFAAADIVTPQGYPLMATNRGEQRAREQVGRYAHELSRDAFRTQWRLHARQMRGMHANMPPAEG